MLYVCNFIYSNTVINLYTFTPSTLNKKNNCKIKNPTAACCLNVNLTEVNNIQTHTMTYYRPQKHENNIIIIHLHIPQNDKWHSLSILHIL